MKLENRTSFSATTPIKSFWKNYWLKEVDVCQKANSQFVQTLFILRKKSKGVFGRNWRRQFFYHNIFDISQSQHRIVRVSKGSYKKTFAIKLFQFLRVKDTAMLYLPRRSENLQKKLTCLVNSLLDLLKTFDHASKCIQVPKVDSGSQSQNTISLLVTITISLNIQMDKFVNCSD